MADGSGIEWTDATWNPMLGCDRVSPGCDGCYAITNANIRAGNPNEKVASAYRGLVRHGDWTGRINLLPDRLDQPLRWRKPRRIFVNSQSDLFHKNVPDEFIAKVWTVMAAAPQHTFQILTKRHGRMRSLVRRLAWRTPTTEERRQGVTGSIAYVQDDESLNDHLGAPRVLPNVWLGVSVENQHYADLRIPALLDTPAAVRWLSCEPLLGPVDLARSLGRWQPGDNQPWDGNRLRANKMLHWVVVGGESGTRARPMHPDWARSLRDQCLTGEIPFFFKQWGEHLPVPVVDKPGMVNGRAYNHYGWHAVGIREPGPSGTYRNATTREMRVGESNRGGTLLDLDTFAIRLGKKKAGRELDGRTWDQMPLEVANV